MTLLSFVIPCYRSEKTIEKVVSEIQETVSQKGDYDYEIICVNDCSPDNVFSVICGLASDNKKIKVVDFAKNMGKHAAVLAGYSFAKGDYIVNLDDDYQSPVNELWKLVAPVENDECDVAMAQYTQKKQAGWKNIGSRINRKIGNFLLNKAADIRFDNFSVMKRFVAKKMAEYPNAYPFLEGLMWQVTSRVLPVEMDERERGDGATTGYTLKKSINLFINGFTAFSVKPLRISTFVGFAAAMIGFIYALVIVIRRLIGEIYVVGYASSTIIQLIVGGLILMSLGLLGEYVGRIYICLNKSPQYVVKNIINIEENNDLN